MIYFYRNFDHFFNALARQNMTQPGLE